MLPDGSSSEATPPESSLSTDIIVLEALLEAERDGVAAMNEVILILRLEIMQLATHIMPATQELEEVRMLHWMPFTLGHNVQPQNLFVEAVHHPCYQMVAVQRQHRRRAV